MAGQASVTELLGATGRFARRLWRECLAVGAVLGAVMASVLVTASMDGETDPGRASGLRELTAETPCMHTVAGPGPDDQVSTDQADPCGVPASAADAGSNGGTGTAAGTRRPARSTSGSSRGGTGALGATPETTSGDGGTDTDPETTTTTTSVHERNAPLVSRLRAGGEVPDGPDEIFDGAACGSTSMPVEAVVVDQSQIHAVTLHWSFPGASGQVAGSSPMARSQGRYTGVLGPFPEGTAPDGSSITITWWVEATDEYGSVGRADAPDGSDPLTGDERVVLADCPG